MTDNTDNRNSPEYRTLILNQRDLSLSFKNNLVSVSGVLVSAEIITPEHGEEARNRMHSANQRADDLVYVVQNEVLKDPQKYRLFIDSLLKESQAQYGSTVTKLESTCKELRSKGKDVGGVCRRAVMVIEQEPDIDEFSVQMTSTQLVTWLQNLPQVTAEFRSELSKFTDQSVNGAVFINLTEDNLKELGLTLGFRIIVLEIIRGLRNQAAQSHRRIRPDEGTARAEGEQAVDDAIGEQADGLNKDPNADAHDMAIGQRLERIVADED